MELPLEVRRDAARYLAIFNDYMDFKIVPWHKHGVDKGRLFPVRKNALRLLKQEIIKQKQAEWDKTHGGGGGGEENDNVEGVEQQEQQQEMVTQKDKPPQAPTPQQLSTYAERKSVRTEHNRIRYSSGGEKYTEVIQNTAEFPVPTEYDLEHWDEDTWMKFAAPLELEAYFKEHPEKKPPGWVNPSETLKTEQTEEEKKSEEEKPSP